MINLEKYSDDLSTLKLMDYMPFINPITRSAGEIMIRKYETYCCW